MTDPSTDTSAAQIPPVLPSNVPVPGPLAANSGLGSDPTADQTGAYFDAHPNATGATLPEIKAWLAAGGVGRPTQATSVPAPPVPAATAPSTAQAGPSPSPPKYASDIDPRLYPVLDMLKRGESGGDYNVLAGGGHFGYPQIPGYTGGSGAYGDVKSTWEHGIAPEVQQRFGRKLDFNNPKDQDFGNAYWAVKTYGIDNNGRNLLQASEANAIDKSRLSGQWISLKGRVGDTTSALLPAWQTAQAEKQKLIDADITQIGELGKQIGALAPDSTERHKLLQDQLDRSRSLQDKLLSMAQNPPQQKPNDIMSAFGSIAMLVAAIGGSRSRQPATASLNAAAGVIEGINANNHEEYERNFKTWQAQTGILEKAIGMQNDDFRAVMENEHLDATERAEQITNLFRTYEMGHGVRMMESGQVDQGFKVVEDMMKWQEDLTYKRKQMDELDAHIAQQRAQTKALESMGGVSGKSDLAQQTRTLLEARAKELGKTYDEVAMDPNEVSSARQKAAQQLSEARGKGTSGGELSDEAADLVAEQYIRGDQNAITSQPRSGPIRRQIENKIAEKVRGVDDAAGQIMMNRMRMAEARSAATTAGRVTMQTELYAREAAGAGQQVIDTSKRFSRTNYPLVNQALAAYETHTGDPSIIEFGTAINALYNAYGKMSNPTGTGIHDADKEQLRKILDTSLSQGQIEAGVERIIKEGRNVATAAEQAQRDVLATIVPGGAATRGAVNVPPEHMSDPDGTTYQGSDNQTYVKRGGQMVPQ